VNPNQSVVSLNSYKKLPDFIFTKQEIYPSLLSTGWFQGRTRAWFTLATLL